MARAGLAILLGTSLLSGCTTAGPGDPVTRTAAQNGYVGAQKSLTQVRPDARKPAPVAAGERLGTATRISTADYAGKVVVLNVWGSWCAPCRQEAADLQQASLLTAGKAQFIGINSRDFDPAPAEAFVRAFKVTYPSIYDPDGAVLVRFAGDLPLSFFPSTLVIDQRGRIAARITGPATRRTLVDLVNDVAAGK